MRLISGARGLGLGIAVLLAAGCGQPAAGPHVTATASPKPAPQPELPNYNSRLGSNRVAAVQGARLGRILYGQGQYWEVYVRTTPVALPGTYDPAHPERSAAAASTVTAADVVMATEAAAAVKAFQARGIDQEKQLLGDLDKALRAAFPNIGMVTVRVFFGESFQYATAVFDHGVLTRYDARRTS